MWMCGVLDSVFPCHSQLKTQMWQLLKGHDHLQDEFSIFFDHLRPAASRMGDFEEINWTEEKEYEVQTPRLQWGVRAGRHGGAGVCLQLELSAPTPPQFDGFEEVALPDVEEEEEPSKIPTASKSKRRKEMGAQNHDKVRLGVGGNLLLMKEALSFLGTCFSGIM